MLRRPILIGLGCSLLVPRARANLVVNELNGFNVAAGGGIQDTGWVIAGQGRSVARAGSGGPAWVNPGNVTADDGTDATWAGFLGAGFSDWLVGDTFDFSTIPSGAAILGIETRVQLSCTNAASSTISAVNIGKDDSTLGTAKTPGTAVTTSKVDYDHGSSVDLWGLTISAAEVKASTFQALLSCNDGSGVAARAFQCDAIWMRVTYSS